MMGGGRTACGGAILPLSANERQIGFARVLFGVATPAFLFAEAAFTMRCT
jgi:hypothetical protein